MRGWLYILKRNLGRGRLDLCHCKNLVLLSHSCQMCGYDQSLHGHLRRVRHDYDAGKKNVAKSPRKATWHLPAFDLINQKLECGASGESESLAGALNIRGAGTRQTESRASLAPHVGHDQPTLSNSALARGCADHLRLGSLRLRL